RFVKAHVGFFQRHAVDENPLLDQVNPIAWNSHHALYEMLRGVHRIVEHNDVTTVDLPVRNDRVPDATPTITKLVDQQVVTDQKSVFHRFRGDLKRLHDIGDDEHRYHYSSQQRLQGSQPVRGVLGRFRGCRHGDGRSVGTDLSAILFSAAAAGEARYSRTGRAPSGS